MKPGAPFFEEAELEAELFIGVDIGGTKTAVSLWEGEERLVQKVQFPTTGAPEAVILQINDLIGRMRAANSAAASGLRALGISCGGPLDSTGGLILGPPNLPGWDRVPIVDALREKNEVPCFLENDANACALAEWRWGAGRGCRDMAFLTFGTGLGCGLILNGCLYRGAGDLAGEVGHIRIAEDGPEGYGKRGSWEGFCSGGGLSRLYAEVTGRNETGKYICDAAERGEADALKVVGECAFYLGRGISLLIDILNPQCIVLGSIFARSEGLFRRIMESVVAEEALAPSREQCAIRPALLGELLGDKAALGVALNGIRSQPPLREAERQIPE
ncbi:MAG: ROK family protein [Spirochaetaceae bacterium]|jgi:glucokinase|nr:ROK family protein [Spirochaetaceae bacterium]